MMVSKVSEQSSGLSEHPYHVLYAHLEAARREHRIDVTLWAGAFVIVLIASAWLSYIIATRWWL